MGNAWSRNAAVADVKMWRKEKGTGYLRLATVGSGDDGGAGNDEKPGAGLSGYFETCGQPSFVHVRPWLPRVAKPPRLPS